MRINLAEHVLLDGQVFVHGLNDEISLGQPGPVGSDPEPGLTAAGFADLELPYGHKAPIVVKDPLLPCLQGYAVLFKQHH